MWRPLIAWSEKFKFEQVESADHVTSPILDTVAPFDAAQCAPGTNLAKHWKSQFIRRLARTPECRVVQPIDRIPNKSKTSIGYWVVGHCLRSPDWGAFQCAMMLRTITLARTPAAARGRRGDLPACECRAAHIRALDHAGRRGHRIQSATGADCSAGRAGLASVPATAFFPFC